MMEWMATNPQVKKEVALKPLIKNVFENSEGRYLRGPSFSHFNSPVARKLYFPV